MGIYRVSPGAGENGSKRRLWTRVQRLVQEKRHILIIWVGVAGFLLLSLLSLAGDGGFLELFVFTRHLERVETQIRTLEGENRHLRQQVVGLRDEPAQIEKMAREDLGLARPDEFIFEIVDAQGVRN